MAINFDALLDALIEKIALRGPRGADFALVSLWTSEIHANAEPASNDARFDQSSGPSTTIGHNLCKAVWGWLQARSDLQIERRSIPLNNARTFSITTVTAPNVSDVAHASEAALTASHSIVSLSRSVPSVNQDLRSSEIADTPTHHDEFSKSSQSISSSPTQTRLADFLVASEHRVWLALTGHDVDSKKIPAFSFDLLLIIAESGACGITQPRLAAMSGQDKRSVPKRTDELHRNGYICKSRVLDRSLWTSLCTLKSFIANKESPTLEGMSSDRLRGVIFRDGALKGDMFVDVTMSYLDERKSVSIEDFRERLGLRKHRMERRLANGMIECMEKKGCLQTQKDVNNNSPTGFILSGITFVRRPTSAEKLEVVHSMGQPKGVQRATTSNVLEDELPDSDQDQQMSGTEPLKTSSVTVAGTWRAEQPLQYSFYDLVDAAGPNGIESSLLVERLGFNFLKKTMEQITGRLTDLWTVSQPSHIRHLAVVRDVSLRAKQHQYLYRTYENCEQAVKAGSVTWEAVTGKASPLPTPSLDAWGFVPIQSKTFLDGDYRATPSQCRRAVVAATSSREKQARATLKRSRRQEGSDVRVLGSAKKQRTTVSTPEVCSSHFQVGNTKQWKTFIKSTRVMAVIAAKRAPEANAQSHEVDLTPRRGPLLSKQAQTFLDMAEKRQDASHDGVLQFPMHSFAQGGQNVQSTTTPHKRAQLSMAHIAASGDNGSKHVLQDDRIGERPSKVVKLNDKAAAVVAQVDTLHEQFLRMNRPGLYIDPPLRVPAKRGPSTRKIVVIKSDRLFPGRKTTTHASAAKAVSKAHNQTDSYRNHGGTAVEPRHEGTNPTRDHMEHPNNDNVNQVSNINGTGFALISAANADSDSRPASAPTKKIGQHTAIHEMNGDCEASAPNTTLGVALNLEINNTSKSEAQKATTIKQSMCKPTFETQAGRVVTGASPQSIRELLHDSPATGEDLSYPAPASESPHGNHTDSQEPNEGATASVDARTRIKRKRVVKFGVTLAGGSLGHKRSATLLKLIVGAGGVYPGNSEIVLPFGQAWQRQEGSQMPAPDTKTVTTAIKNLVASERLVRHYFAFKTYQGQVISRSILAVPGIVATDARVADMQKQIERCYPNSHRPGWSDSHAVAEADDLEGDADPANPPKRTAGPFNNRTGARVVNRTPNLERLKFPDRASLDRETREIAELEADVTADQASMQSSMQMAHYAHEDNQAYTGRSRLHRLSRRRGLDAAKRVQSRSLPQGPLGYMSLAASSGVDPNTQHVARMSRLQRDSLLWSAKPASGAHHATAMAENDSSSLRKQLILFTAPGQAKHVSSGTISTDFGLMEDDDMPSAEPTTTQTSYGNRKRATLSANLLDLLGQHRRQPNSIGEASRWTAEDPVIQDINDVEDWELRNPEVLARDQPGNVGRFINHVVSWAATTWQKSTAYKGKGARTGRIRGTQSGEKKIGMSGPQRSRIASTSQKKVLKITEAEVHRLISCVCLVQLLAGGASRKILWSTVQQMYDSQSSEAVLREKWKSIRLGRAEELRHFRINLQEAFLVEYSNGTAPEINYQHLALSDWASLLQWTLDRWRKLIVPVSQCTLTKSKKSTDSPSELPGQRQQLHRYNAVVKHDDRSEILRLNISTHYFPMKWNQHWRHVPFECGASVEPMTTDKKRQADANEQLEIAERYIRANVFTPDERYDSAAAFNSLRQFPQDLIDQGLESLLRARIVVPKAKGHHIPGRNFKLADHFSQYYARQTLKNYPKILEDAVRYRSSIESLLAHPSGQSTQMKVPYHVSDGQALALCNLIASGQMRISAKMPPVTRKLPKALNSSRDASIGAEDEPGRALSIWGFTTNNYKTMHVEGGNTVFPLYVQLTDRSALSWEADDKRATAPTAPLSSEVEGVTQSVPVWYDIHGSLIPDVWTMIVGHTATTLALLPGSNVEAILAHEGASTGYHERDLLSMLDWMEEQGLATRTGTALGTREQGWIVAEQWWTRLEQMRRSLQEDDSQKQAQGGVEETAGTSFSSRPHEI